MDKILTFCLAKFLNKKKYYESAIVDFFNNTNFHLILLTN